MPSFPKFAPDDCCGLGAVIRDEQGGGYQGVMVVGEAGGYNELQQRRPFVGDSGRVLESLLDSVGLKRENVYITNVVQHRPPGNRKPTQKEVSYHREFVEAAIQAACPSVILAIGGTALAWFDKNRKLTNCHGKAFGWRGIVVVPMYHPAYAMRNPSVWPLLYADFAAPWTLPTPRQAAIYRLSSEAEAAALAYTHKRIGFDLETTDRLHEGVFYPHMQEILGYSVAWKPGQSVYVAAQPGPWMQGVLENESIVKVCHNARLECQLLSKYGITLRNFEDTKIKAYLLQCFSSRLKDLSYQELDIKQLTLKEVTRGRPTVEVTAEEWLPYAAADADVTLQLDDKLTQRLKKEGLEELYYRFELPLVPILAEAGRRGGLIDKQVFQELEAEMAARRESLHGELQQWFPNINLNSTEQVGEVVFGKRGQHVEVKQALKTRTHIRYVPAGLGLKVVKKTKTGQPALDKEVYAALEDKHPAMGLLAEYHRLGDYISDFVGKIPRLVLEDGALHTSINQAGTWEDSGREKESPATGRLSSSGPNLMQIPKRDPIIAKKIRQGFVAREGYTWVSADMKQQEVRLMALMSGDERLQADFKAGVDVYMEVAHLFKQVVTHDPMAMVESSKERDRWGFEYRDTAKNKVFLPMQYTAQAAKLAQIHPGLTIQTAGAILEGLRDKYPKVVEYAREQERKVAETGYAVTLFGRKRWLPGIWVRQSKNEAARQAANHPIQGTGADVLKGCLVWLWGPEGKLREYDAHLLWPIHDSVDVEVRDEQVPDVVAVLWDMTSWFDAIDLPVDVSIGKNWGELKEV